MALYNFTISTDNKTYACERFVSGLKERRQTVKVSGLRSKKDPAIYNDKTHSPAEMQLNARLIAHEIIKEGGNDCSL
jgi:hypothetical protein